MPHHIAKILLIICFSLPVATLCGQTRSEMIAFRLLTAQRRSNVTFGIGGGASTLMVDNHIFSPSQIGGGGNFEIGYSYLWNHTNGIHIGIAATYSHSGFHQDDVQSSHTGFITVYNKTDQEVRRSHFTANTSSINESYNVTYLQIPVQLLFQDIRYYMLAGVRLMMPVIASANYDYGETGIGVGTSVDGLGVTLPAPIYTRTIESRQGTYKLSSLGGKGPTSLFFATISLEGGYRWPIDRQRMICLSLYADISINTSHTEDEDFLFVENEKIMMGNAIQSNLTSSLRYLSIGLRLTYNYSYGKPIGFVRSKPFPKPKRHRRYRF